VPIGNNHSAPLGKNDLLERYFHLSENQTTLRREFLGGLTTFLTMAYIVAVNPKMLSETGMPVEGVLFATCAASAAATLVMGLYANYPIALAPGMSLNAYFTYVVCLGMHVPWRTALGVIFLSGCAFLVLTVTRVREQIVDLWSADGLGRLTVHPPSRSNLPRQRVPSAD